MTGHVECKRCGEEATLPTVALLVAYMRQHDEVCKPTEDRCERCPISGDRECRLNCPKHGGAS